MRVYVTFPAPPELSLASVVIRPDLEGLLQETTAAVEKKMAVLLWGWSFATCFWPLI